MYDGGKQQIFTSQLDISHLSFVARVEELKAVVRPQQFLTNLSTSNNTELLDLFTGEIDNDGVFITKSNEWDFNQAKLRVIEHLQVRDLFTIKMVSKWKAWRG